MLLQILGHAEALDPLSAEDRRHGRVGSEELLVLGILEVLLLEVGPESLDNLSKKI